MDFKSDFVDQNKTILGQYWKIMSDEQKMSFTHYQRGRIVEAAEVSIRKFWKTVGVMLDALIENRAGEATLVMGMALRTPRIQIGELIVLKDIFYPKHKILSISLFNHIYKNIYMLYGYIRVYVCKFLVIIFFSH